MTREKHGAVLEEAEEDYSFAAEWNIKYTASCKTTSSTLMLACHFLAPQTCLNVILAKVHSRLLFSFSLSLTKPLAANIFSLTFLPTTAPARALLKIFKRQQKPMSGDVRTLRQRRFL
jgi:hypothetical protein